MQRQGLAFTIVATCLGGHATAQPAPSFEATCNELHGELAKLGDVNATLITIAVRGKLTLAQHNGPLAYMAACSEPHPRVLCVTYGLSGLKVGDEVVLTGAVNRVDPDHIMLDPCLGGPANE